MGQKSIPDIHELPSPQERSVPVIGSVYLFSVPHLNTSCRGTVTAIEYCYQYNLDYLVSGSEAVFNWTVLILNSQLTITNTFAIESHPANNSHQKSRWSDVCHDCTCTCDTTFISGFDLPEEKFTFGVMSSPQGNTHDAALLAFHPSLDKYIVNVVNFPARDQQLTKGSTVHIDDNQHTRLGFCTLWFVIGK